MSALNQKNTAVQLGTKKMSYEGNLQDVKSASQQLYEIAVTSMYGKDTFYESNSNVVKRLEQHIQSVVKAGNVDFIANVIIHARTVMNIRTMPVVMTCLFAKALRDQNKSFDHLRSLVCDVIQRADQLTDMYSAALMIFGDGVDPNQRKRQVPMAIKRGVADAFLKFNEYQFAKYDRANAVKLRDVLRIVHPKAKDEASFELIKKIKEERLETPYTWEVELSKNDKPKDQIWSELINSGKVGYMATLRNLRNILEAGVPSEDITKVCNFLSDESQVLKSKQLPFRFVNALEAVEQTTSGKSSKVVTALSKALDTSLQNVPSIGRRLWIIIDCSSSMTSDQSNYNPRTRQYERSGNSPIKTACLFGAALFKSNAFNADDIAISMFSDRSEIVTGLNGTDSVLTLTQKLMNKVYGGGTALDSALRQKPQLGFEPDTVIVISDMQVSSLRPGDMNIFASDCVKIALNVQAYETTPCGEISGWYQLSGWSEKIFDFIPAFRDKTSVVKKLNIPYQGMEIKRLFKTSSNSEE